MFWLITRGDRHAALSWQILPQSYLLFLMLCFLLPIKRMSRSGRLHFLSTLKRISLGGLAEVQDGKFGDILLADVLTSYAKVLGDLFVSTCMLFSRKTTSTAKPDRGCGGAYLVPLIISIPSMIRLRQCLIEYLRVRRNRTSMSGWGGQHLANALKYASAFPVIVLSALQRGYDPTTFHMTEAGLFRLWYGLFAWVSDNDADMHVQVTFRFCQLILFVLLGRGQRLGSVTVLVEPGEERSRASLWPTKVSVFSRQGNVLYGHCDRSSTALYMELQALPALRPLQRSRGWDFPHGDFGSTAALDVDISPGRDRMG